VAVRIRMKKMGRRHRPFYRICAMDSRSPRDGKAIEELGYYDPMIRDVDARAVLDGERIDYWLGTGAQPSEKVRALIKKYGTHGTHVEQQRAALEKLRGSKRKAASPVAVSQPRQARQDEQVPAQEEPAASGDQAAESVAEVGGQESGE